MTAHSEVYSIQHYVIKFVSDLRQISGFSPGIPLSSTNISNKTDHHNIVESGFKHHNPNPNQMIILALDIIQMLMNKQLHYYSLFDV